MYEGGGTKHTYLPVYASEKHLPNEFFLFEAWNFPVECWSASFLNLLVVTEGSAHFDPQILFLARETLPVANSFC